MADLTISQALRRIKKLKGELAEYTARATASVAYQANREPAFKFGECMEKAETSRQELLSLQARLAETNATTLVKFDGKEFSLSFATRQLEEFKGQIKFIEGLPVRDHAKSYEDTFDYNDDMKRVKISNEWRCELPKSQQAEAIKKFKEKFDTLNDAVETTNHRTVLKA